MIMKSVYDGNNNKIELEDEKVFADFPNFKIYEYSNLQIIKLYSDTMPFELQGKINFILNQKLEVDGVLLPQSMVYSVSGDPIGYIFQKPEGYNLLRSIFIKSQFNKLFPDWQRVNLVTLCISLLKIIKNLHSNSIFIGNLNPKSIYVKDDSTMSIINADELMYNVDPVTNGSDFESDDFITAVFLYMILIPGKPPFPVKLGTNALDNLLKMFQLHSSKNDTSWESPEDEDKYLWISLPSNIQSSFYKIFNKQKRMTEDMWIQQLENFRSELQENKQSPKIFKRGRDKDSFKYTTSMNLHDGGFGYDRTFICKGEDKNCKIAVIELSTKAVKLLIGEKNCINESFEFDAFSRSADLTNTGKGLDENNHMPIDFFKNTVVPSIEKYIKIAQETGVTEIFTVATAAYRAARNNKEILQYLKDSHNLNVRVLSKEEEAQASFNAFVFSGKEFINRINDYVILVDQGGGSTEISLFKDLKLQKSISLNLGTTVLQNILLNKTSLNMTLADALIETDSILDTRLNHYFEDLEEIKHQENINCIALGSAITTATNVRGNKNQHGIRLTKNDIQKKIRETDQIITRSFKSIKDLMVSIQRESSMNRSALENLLIMRLGLPMFLKIFEYFNISELVVSGTGLWYGIFWQRCLELNGN